MLKKKKKVKKSEGLFVGAVVKNPVFVMLIRSCSRVLDEGLACTIGCVEFQECIVMQYPLFVCPSPND